MEPKTCCEKCRANRGGGSSSNFGSPDYCSNQLCKCHIELCHSQEKDTQAGKCENAEGFAPILKPDGAYCGKCLQPLKTHTQKPAAWEAGYFRVFDHNAENYGVSDLRHNLYNFFKLELAAEIAKTKAGIREKLPEYDLSKLGSENQDAYVHYSNGWNAYREAALRVIDEIN